MGAEENKEKSSLSEKRGKKRDHLYRKCCFPHTTNVSCSVLKDNDSFLILDHRHSPLSREQGENKAKTKKKKRDLLIGR